MIKVAPSILSADFANLAQEVRHLTSAGADYIHIDVMDGNFVPNLTIGAGVVSALRGHTHLPLDVHLMVANPDQYLEQFAEAGSDIITFHLEAAIHANRTAAKIRSLGKRVGISIVPSTPPSMLSYLMDQVDLILVMSVNPGFGGQKFIPSSLQKISELKQMIQNSGRNIELEVDGGIDLSTAADAVTAGADVLVAGNYIFNQSDGKLENYAARIDSLKQSAASFLLRDNII